MQSYVEFIFETVQDTEAAPGGEGVRGVQLLPGGIVPNYTAYEERSRAKRAQWWWGHGAGACRAIHCIVIDYYIMTSAAFDEHSPTSSTPCIVSNVIL